MVMRKITRRLKRRTSRVSLTVRKRARQLTRAALDAKYPPEKPIFMTARSIMKWYSAQIENLKPGDAAVLADLRNRGLADLREFYAKMERGEVYPKPSPEEEENERIELLELIEKIDESKTPS